MKEIFKKMREFSVQRNIDSLCKLTSIVFNLLLYCMQLLQLIGAQRICNDAIGCAKYDVIFWEFSYFIKQNWVISFTFLFMPLIKKPLSINFVMNNNYFAFLGYYKYIIYMFWASTKNNDKITFERFLSRSAILNSNSR